MRPVQAGGKARWRLRLSEQMVSRYVAEGAWRNRTIGERLDALATACPDRALFTDGARNFSVTETRSLALRLAGALLARGYRPGEVISFQLPNWHEAVLIELACGYAGFVCNPIVPIFRKSEVEFMLRDSGSRALFVADRFRGFDFPAMTRALAPACPELVETFVVRGSAPGCVAFDTLIAGPEIAPPPPPDPDSVKLLLYTSGTTSRPKGVLHTHNTIDAEIRNFAAHLDLGGDDVVLMPSTLCHITGYLYAIQLPITLGARAVLMDNWDAAQAAALIDAHRVTFTIGATPFIRELAAFAEAQGLRLPSLRYFPTGGAPVPPAVIALAEAAFVNCCSFRIYGSTEAPTVSLGSIHDSDRISRATTEGVVVGHEVRLVDAGGAAVPAGAEGEIVTRGPEVCVGYVDAAQTEEAFDADGFFRTGDLARFTPEGRLVITGRKKDIIIRGGENISPREVEDILSAHEGVTSVAVVAMPHERLGETACAFVTLAEGRALTFAEMQALLRARGIARQKWPEKLVILPCLPHNAAGKILKGELRLRAQAFGESE